MILTQGRVVAGWRIKFCLLPEEEALSVVFHSEGPGPKIVLDTLFELHHTFSGIQVLKLERVFLRVHV